MNVAAGLAAPGLTASGLAAPCLGHRILVWGSSCAGKSTTAEQLAQQLDIPFVDLDALNWLPNWVGLNMTDPDRLVERITNATSGSAWVVAGSYTKQSQATFWPRLQTIIWLDLPLPLLLYRVLTRSWRRWRSKELLWGTNYENFWDQLKVWKGEKSLVWWIVTQHKRKRADVYRFMMDPQWSHIHFVRINNTQAIDLMLKDLGRQ